MEEILSNCKLTDEGNKKLFNTSNDEGELVAFRIETSRKYLNNSYRVEREELNDQYIFLSSILPLPKEFEHKVIHLKNIKITKNSKESCESTVDLEDLS